MASPVKNISVFYTHSASNIGDIAINRGAQFLIERAFPGCQINFVSLSSVNPEFHNDLRASFTSSGNLHHSAFSKDADKIFDYISDPDAFLEACGAGDADLVLVNSGEHLVSYDSADNADSLFWNTFPVYAAKRAGKSAAILPSTFGPFYTLHSKNLVRSIVMLADGAAAREPQSLRMLSELLGCTVSPVLPDPAFFISPKPVAAEGNAKTVRLGVSMRLETLGVCHDGDNRLSQKTLAKGGATSLVEAFQISICRSFLAKAGHEIILFVQTDADAALAVAIFDALSPEQQSAVRIERPISIDDYCEQLGGIDYLVTSRFHEIILGTLMRRPSTGVYFGSHSHNVPSLVEMYPALGKAFNISALDADRTAHLVLEEIEAAAGFRSDLDVVLEQHRQEAVTWLQGCGNKTADPALLLQAATSLAFYGNQLREADLKREANAATKSASRQHYKSLAATHEQITELRKNIDQLVNVSRVAIDQAVDTVQTGLQYKIGQEVIEALKRPYRLAMLPLNLWRIRDDHSRKVKSGKIQSLADLNKRVVLENAQSRSLVDYQEEIGTTSNRPLLRSAFWSAFKEKDKGNCMRIVARLEQLQSENYVEPEEKFLSKLRSKLSDEGIEYSGNINSPLNLNSVELGHWRKKKNIEIHKDHRAVEELSTINELKIAREEAENFEKLDKSKQDSLIAIGTQDVSPECRILPIRNTICYFLHNSLPHASGAYATRTHSLAVALAGRGYWVTAVTRPGFPVSTMPGFVNGSINKKDLIDGIAYHRLLEPKRTDGKTAASVLEFANLIEALLRKLRPEFVMVESNFHTGLPVLIAARRLGIPFIYEARGFWEVTPVTQDPSLATQTSYALQSFMEVELSRRADAVLTLTRGMIQKLVSKGVPADTITLVPNACDTNQFLPRERSKELGERLGIPADVPVIGHIGSFVQYEGLDDLASACALLKRWGVEFRLMIAGNENVSGGELGPITASIKEIAESGGFADWLIMPGLVPHGQVPDYYSLIDIAPFPRKPQPVTEMVSPMTPLEAMAMKKAVIVSSVDALAEMVRDGETGTVFEKGNIEDLAKRIGDLIADPELRSCLSEAGRLWVETERTWSASAKSAADAFDLLKFVRVENDLRTIEGLIPPKNALAYTPDPDRVLYVLHNSMPYASGGYATRGHGLAKGLREIGFSVSCFTRPGFPADRRKKFQNIEIEPELNVDGIVYRNDQSLRRDSVSDIDYIRHAADVYEAEIRCLRPAYVQAASFATWTGIPALIAARRTGTPFAYEVRGLAEITNMSRVDDYAATLEYKWLASLEAIACKHADHVFTLNGGMKDEIASRGIDPSMITLLPNSCDVDNFHPAVRDASLADRLGIENEDMVIGYIGTFVDYEGLEDLAAACVQLKQRGVKFKLLLVGSENVQKNEDGPIARLIREIVAHGDIEDHVIMPGRVPHNEVHEYYSLIDIAAFPRKPLPVTELVSPMKPLEAMAMAKAVLVSSVRALAEMVRDGETGVVFEKGNIIDLTDKLEWLSGDIELRRRIGKNSRQWVQENRTWKATAGTLAGQIRTMI